MYAQTLETEQKALTINLNPSVYGAFAEIGAGQEVARHFFQVGAAAGTVAKTMSAYDKTVSDDIYGPEEKGRYVCENRLYKMLDHEYQLLWRRLRNERPEQTFFAFANTVSAINFQKTIKGQGWLGVRFQLHPEQAHNDLVIHARLLDNDNRLQQQAIGILGVNMIYACFYLHHSPEDFIISLMDNLRGRVQIDMVRLTGPNFENLDNRLVCLWSVKHQLTNVVIFGYNGMARHASEFLYKKAIIIARGSYRPPTLVQEDMNRLSYEQFKKDVQAAPKGTYFLTEITLDNLTANGTIDEKDYLDRVELLCAMRQTVIISSCLQHRYLIAYFAEYKIQHIGLTMGVRKLQKIVEDTYQSNQDNLLEAFGGIFLKNVRFYIYPAQVEGSEMIHNIHTVPVNPGIRFLYQHLLENGNITDVEGFNPDVLHIHHKEVLQLIKDGDPRWREMVPTRVAEIIKEKKLFGYQELINH